MNERLHSFVWLDLETTGLDPNAGKILEWAIVMAADDRDGDMQPVETVTDVIHCSPEDAAALCDDYVTRMHTESGLLADCAESTATLEEAEDFILGYLQAVTGKAEPAELVIAGFNPSYDVAWLRVHMPRVAACLDYHTFDVRTLEAAAKAWGPTFKKPVVEGTRHRALADCLYALATAGAIREAVGL